MIGVSGEESCIVYENLATKILGIISRDSHKFGISRSNIISLQKKTRENRVVKLHKETMQKIISGCIMTRGCDTI